MMIARKHKRGFCDFTQKLSVTSHLIQNSLNDKTLHNLYPTVFVFIYYFSHSLLRFLELPNHIYFKALSLIVVSHTNFLPQILKCLSSSPFSGFDQTHPHQRGLPLTTLGKFSVGKLKLLYVGHLMNSQFFSKVPFAGKD